MAELASGSLRISLEAEDLVFELGQSFGSRISKTSEIVPAMQGNDQSRLLLLLVVIDKAHFMASIIGGGPDDLRTYFRQ
jgi:hypothetical protein